ncbi:hypothetical protein FGA82_21875 [Pseudomonas fluorescens]|uniref:DUF5462 family protein n=1 Tax=Pseudomonas fluorescens TaxID=294 RepID=UPI0014863562|nr:DUF5462 family protein [Pseudomonas fluorescens]TMU74126.1 hypothetical protein FGA82_21875 [Pseudomonas fluorescens]
MKPYGWFALLLMVADQGQAAQGYEERNTDLGLVNGVVRHDQVVEAERALSNPVLFEVSHQETPNMPTLLLVRHAQAEDGGGGALLLKQTQQMPVPGGQPVSLGFKSRVKLWVNGEVVNASYRTQGSDVLIPLPAGATSVSLRSDGPVSLLYPKSYRGELSLVLEIEGWQETP